MEVRKHFIFSFLKKIYILTRHLLLEHLLNKFIHLVCRLLLYQYINKNSQCVNTVTQEQP